MTKTKIFSRVLSVVAVGICFVMAGCNDKTEYIPVSFLTLSETEIKLEAGEIYLLECILSPYNADNQRIIWSSSDNAVATVKDGVVTAIKDGSAIVTAMADDNGKTAKCIVMVSGGGGNENNGGEQEEPKGPATLNLDMVTAATATFTGHLDVAASDLSFSQVTVYYSDAETFNMNAAESVAATSFDNDQNFTITLTNLKFGTKYNYCMVVEVKSEKTYGEIRSFTTLPHPYDFQQDLSMASAVDISSSESANCYIVSKSGTYKFRTVKGNSTTSVGSVVSASILWESFCTNTAPEMLDLISAFCYKDGYIVFKTAGTLEGNAVIAAKDAFGNILWSWHIWLTDEPKGQVYYNGAGTMMDRNLGATSATPGDVGALGLLYQWGRKDPFLGSSRISGSAVAHSTTTWPSTVSSNSSCGTIEYSTSHPTTFIKYNSNNYDWYYTGSSSTDNTRWTTSDEKKSIYDPCPPGWRVPDGGSSGVWSKAKGSSSEFENTHGSGMNFSGKFGSASNIWYPASGYRSYSGGSLGYVSVDGCYWSASPSGYCACSLYFSEYGYVYPWSGERRANGYSVRCLQE